MSSTVLLRDKGEKPGPLDFGAKCKRLEEVMSSTLWSCCAGRRTNPCVYCNDVLPPTGFHWCEFEEYPAWKPGTLYSQGENVAETHIIDCRERGESFGMIKAHIKRFVADAQMTKEEGQRWLRMVATEMCEPVCFEDDMPRKSTHRVQQGSQLSLDEQVQQLKKVWSFEANAYVLPTDKVTSQYKAFEAFCKMQTSPNPLLAVVIAPAGFGKNELVK